VFLIIQFFYLYRRIAAAMASAYPDGQFCIQLNGSTPNPIKVRRRLPAIFSAAICSPPVWDQKC
jgi:hypothetical protein